MPTVAMDFHLQFPIPTFSRKVNYKHGILFMGSCFSENIGETMKWNKFNVNINPNGILFNPKSITKALTGYLENKAIEEDELFFENGCWNAWNFHSRFSDPDKNTCLAEMNKSIFAAHQVLKNAEWLFITLGSSFVYKNIEKDVYVANCHKVPQNKFSKSLLPINEIVSDFSNMFERIKKFNPELKIVFTVSPVRYIKDGAMENTLSKARLFEAIHQLVSIYKNAFYFPAYELVIDDLRDYRFYKSDLIHPNDQAIDYVFEKLKDALFDEETKMIYQKIKEVIIAKQHKPFNTLSQEYLGFKASNLKKCDQLLKAHPFLDLKEELDFFQQ